MAMTLLCQLSARVLGPITKCVLTVFYVTEDTRNEGREGARVQNTKGELKENLSKGS